MPLTREPSRQACFTRPIAAYPPPVPPVPRSSTSPICAQITPVIVMIVVSIVVWRSAEQFRSLTLVAPFSSFSRRSRPAYRISANSSLAPIEEISSFSLFFSSFGVAVVAIASRPVTPSPLRGTGKAQDHHLRSSCCRCFHGKPCRRWRLSMAPSCGEASLDLALATCVVGSTSLFSWFLRLLTSVLFLPPPNPPPGWVPCTTGRCRFFFAFVSAASPFVPFFVPFGTWRSSCCVV